MELDSAVFYSHDIEKTIPFYLDLGLTLDYQAEDKFVSFKFSNSVKLGIKRKVEDREIPGSGTIFIKAENIEELFLRLKAKGHIFLKELKEEKWGWEFNILDPDNNKIVFVKRNK